MVGGVIQLQHETNRDGRILALPAWLRGPAIWAARVGIALVALELASCAALSWHERRLVGPGQPVGQQAALAADHAAGEQFDTLRSGSSRLVVHPYLGYVRDPSSVSGLADHPGAFPVSEYGFEDDKLPLYKRSEDRLTVAIFGGSVANRFSAGVGGERLRQDLQALVPDREVALVHVALDGYKQPQQLMALNYLLALGGEFDMVINLDGFNEVALARTRNVDHGVNLAFPRDWNLLVEELPDHLSTSMVGEIVWLRERRGAWARRFAGTPLGCTATAQLVWMVRDRWLERELDRRVERFAAYEPDDPWSPTKGPREQHGDDDDLAVDLVDLWSRSSQLMAEVCRENDIVYLHFLQPNQYVADTHVVGPRTGADAIFIDQPLRAATEAGYPLLIEAGTGLAAQGVDFEDLTDLFAEVDEQVYCDACCHLNDTGNLALEERILAAIAQHIRPS
jgi:hypothetical protein